VFEPNVTLLHPSLPDPENDILIDSNCNARLTDFSLVTIALDQSTATPTFRAGGAIRWMSPELSDAERFGLKDDRPTKESDCYALGMVIYEVLSGKIPFAQCSHAAVMLKVLNGERPMRPRGKKGELFTDDMWGTLELCWKDQPRDRISASVILLRLERHPPLLRSPCDEDGDTEASSDDQWDADTTASDCAFPPLHPGLIFDSPCTV
jgi:serine/threonine protein kinase